MIEHAYRRYYNEHKDEWTQEFANVYLEKVRKRERNYRKKNKDTLNSYHKEWSDRHRDELNQKNRDYRKRNKEVISIRTKQKRQENLLSIREYERNFRSSNIHNFLSHKLSQLISKSQEAKNRNKSKYKVTIDIQFLEELWKKQDGKCAITGKILSYKKDNLFTASIDRIDSKLPYSKDNVQLVCQAINFAKNKYSNQDITYFLGNESYDR